MKFPSLTPLTTYFSKYSKDFLIALGCCCTSLICLLFGITVLLFSPQEQKVEAQNLQISDSAPVHLSGSTQPEEDVKSESEKQIFVDIAGAVRSPGLYILKDGARVSEAINQAGGFHTKVDQLYVSQQLNLAIKLVDEEKMYIPFKGEKPLEIKSFREKTAGASNSKQEKISINTASLTQLKELDGIGDARAQKIIELRPYATLESLLEKGVVGEAVFAQIASQITL